MELHSASDDQHQTESKIQFEIFPEVFEIGCRRIITFSVEAKAQARVLNVSDWQTTALPLVWPVASHTQVLYFDLGAWGRAPCGIVRVIPTKYAGHAGTTAQASSRDQHSKVDDGSPDFLVDSRRKFSVEFGPSLSSPVC